MAHSKDLNYAPIIAVAIFGLFAGGMVGAHYFGPKLYGSKDSKTQKPQTKK
ncbi:hypothetical protein [Aquimarina algicola]|uniref:hypothetical protein n=1 Tax=Aquimarina algicola TaxID=2589995 RepID=UPI001CF555EF|nr:hypothetical protein [Aquimarina algicola]